MSKHRENYSNSYSKCSKCLQLAFTQALSHLRHWSIASSMTDCCTRCQSGVASSAAEATLKLVPDYSLVTISIAFLRCKVLWQHFCQILSKSVYDKIRYSAKKKGVKLFETQCMFHTVCLLLSCVLKAD